MLFINNPRSLGEAFNQPNTANIYTLKKKKNLEKEL